MKALVIDLNKCNGCHSCQEACKEEHAGNDRFPHAKPQPEKGHFWHKVVTLENTIAAEGHARYMHTLCQHCDESPCIRACPNGAIYKRDDGMVIIDPNACCGSKACIDACPYAAIYFNYDLNISQKCTMCAHRLSRGLEKPRCVEVCPTGALTFGEEWQLKELVARSEMLNPEYRPRVHYIGLSKSIGSQSKIKPRHRIRRRVLAGV